LKSSLFIPWVLVAIFCQGAMAGLPTGLSDNDVDRLVEYLGPPATTRFMRSAESYEVFPGVRFAVEIAFVPTREVNDLGDRNGTLAALNPTPKLSFSKGLLGGFEIQANYFPQNIINVVSGFGGGLKWTYFDERQDWFSGAFYGAFTRLSGFEQTYSGSNYEGGFVVSKDFVRMRPYLGMGVVLSTGEVPSNYAKRPAEREGFYSTFHSFLGCEILLPVTIAVELDMMNLSPMFTALVGKSF
jgi:hypothetical protein